MEDKINASKGPPTGLYVPDISFHKLDEVPERLEVFPLPREEIIEHPDFSAAPDKLFGEMRPDKTGAPRYKKTIHWLSFEGAQI